MDSFPASDPPGWEPLRAGEPDEEPHPEERPHRRKDERNDRGEDRKDRKDG